MRILYIASNPTDEANLNLVRDINEIQRRFDDTSVDPISLTFLPDLKVDDLPGELSKRRPDILHLSAHGDKEHLALADEDGRPVRITATMLAGFLAPNHRPKLIYLNACNSVGIAKSLVKLGAVQLAIGSTAPITNRVARTSAVAFYERVLAGLTVEQAFEACKQMAEAMAGSRASVQLHRSREVSTEIEVLHPVPRLVADFMDGKLTAAFDGHYGFRLGLMGCPSDTVQVSFFTDDESFITSDDTLEEDLSWVLRTSPVNGTIWTDSSTIWRAQGDHRLLAVGVKSGSGAFVVESSLCEAVENRYRLSAMRGIPKAVSTAIRTLRANNGAELNPAVWDGKLKRLRDQEIANAKKVRA